MTFVKEENAKVFAEAMAEYREGGGRLADEPTAPEGYEIMGMHAFRMFKGAELHFESLTLAEGPVGMERRKVDVRSAPDAPTPWSVIEDYLREDLGWTEVFSVSRIKSVVFLDFPDTYSARGR